MRRRKKKLRRTRSGFPKKLFIILGAVAVIVIASLLLTLYRRPPQIDERNTQKNLPLDVKKELETSTPSATFRVPILLYHYVEYVKDPKDTIRQSLDIVPSVFEKQLQTLIADNYTFITPSGLADVLEGKKKLPPKPIIITFDDGYRDFYTDVLPILQRYPDVRVVAYVVPGFLDTPNFLLTSQLEEIAQSNQVEIAAHTMHHLWLKGMSKDRAQKEISQSKTTLEDLLHIPIVSFAYPYGAFDSQTVQMVKDAGFKTAVSTIPGIEVNQADRFFLYRIRPGARTGKELINFLSQNAFRPW
ncbi:MAG TPA: polysaccharide deacetylase family protein [Candidatus Saccharimonadales bacterium]|nr:polysaccharide deacetylase family protein [Candidatus Saccharimonadales bacterium]